MTAETSRATSLTKELAKTKQSLAFSVTEVKESQERVEELEAEIDRMEGEIAGVDKAEKKKSKLEMKEISNLKANITEEVEKREVVEEQVKTLKVCRFQKLNFDLN